MGMFDTFWGKYKCPACGATIKFEEKTTQYENMLEDFLLGDFVDKANTNYFYEFEDSCKECKAINNIALAIRNGQYAGIFINGDDKPDIMEVPNIEERYERHRIYEQMCAVRVGDEEYSSETDPVMLHRGEVITALQREWIIDEVYKEKLREEEKEVVRILHHNGYVYRTHSGEDVRIISIRRNPFTDVVMVCVRENNWVQKEHWSSEDYKTRFVQAYGCDLQKLE